MTDPSTPDTALPSVPARVVAFVGVFFGAAIGAAIGYSFATLQCSHSGCELSRGLFLWAGSIVGALGAAVVGVVTLRAAGEWRTVQPKRKRR